MTPSGTEGQVLMTEENGKVTVTLSHPRHRNAMTAAMWADLLEIAEGLTTRPDLRVVILRGAGHVAFCGGADVLEMARLRGTPEQADTYDTAITRTIQAIEAIPCPVISQLHGACFGAGTALALSTDLRFGSDTLRVAIPAARLGIGYDPDWIARVDRTIGRPATALLLLSAHQMDAAEALRCGFVNEVYPDGALDAAVARIADRIAKTAPLSYRAAKVALRAVDRSGAPAPDHWTAARETARACVSSADYADAIDAFTHGRAPRFTGS